MLEVCEAIFSVLGTSCLQFLSSVDEWKTIENKFSERWNFPHCVGALDGKHVVMQACGQGSLLHNYKGSLHYFTLVERAQCKHSYMCQNGSVNSFISFIEFTLKFIQDNLHGCFFMPVGKLTL